ncbi:MAG TPA: methyltransferase domain-containing protein [Acidimicrobiales bacterium]|nr:methyltransferase domain-containing protein [Acidimicrobiales bacterium]
MSELDVLSSLAGADRADDPHVRHLTSPLSRRDYMRIADQTVGGLRGGRLLDWGCGYGQLSWLLARRGVAVTSYDVGPAIAGSRSPLVPLGATVRGGRLDGLPFRSRAFDAVLACGVLEHVVDVGRSLEELHRVLVPDGQLFVYNLPNRYSYKEALIGRLQLGYSHDRRYTRGSIAAVLGEHGFRVVSVSRAGFLPHLATGLPAGARRVYDRMSPGLYAVDRVASRTPGLRLVAQSLEVVAERA